MAEVKYERDTQLFDCLGLDVNRPVDSVKPKKFPYMKNCRSYVAGRMEPRFGITSIGEVVAGQSPVHSVRRLNDPANATFTRVVGAGTHLAVGIAAFTDLDSGYSGDPLALQPWHPVASPVPYMYVGDRSRMRKVTVGGILDTIGYAPPNVAPGVALQNTPSYKVIDDFDATGSWAQGGTAGAPSLISRTPGGASGTNTTIDQILFDTGTTGWACVALTSMVGVGYGERLTFEPGTADVETATVQKVTPGSLTASAITTTISRIVYDSGATGLASLVLATPIEQVQIDGLIRNSTVGPENARIIAVSKGPDGTTSIRISTTNTWAATNTVQIVASLRVYLTINHAAGDNVRTDAVRSAITTGTGTLSLVSALDLSQIASGVATQPDDYMHISLRVDRPDLVTEVKAMLDVDVASVAAGVFTGSEFTRNFYYRAFRSSDLTPNVRNQQSLVSTNATIIQRQILDNTTANQIDRSPSNTGVLPNQVTTPPDDPSVQSQQLESGDTQWVDLVFHISDLIRVGTDDTRTLQNVVGLRITAIVTGAVTLDMDSWWIGGGSGPDAGDTTAVDYSYRYRVRNPATNVRSNPSPATRLLVSPMRQSVAVTPTQYAAPSGTNITATNLVLDIERFGGQITDWHYIGTINNVASPGFIDTYADDLVGGNPIFGIEDYQPWPVIGVPVSGTTGSVAGTSVQDSGTNFNTSWAQGTRILINNQPYTIYRVISTSLLEIVENAGSQTAVTWRIDEPTILAQPLPCLWEWDGTFFACGDNVNPGRLYYSNPESETTRTENYLDITSPSEPLMNGIQYNVRSYVFGSESFIQILKTNNPEAPYRHEHIPNGKGLFSRWGLTREPAPFICFLSRDGINMTSGGAPVVLTDADLYELFPNEGNIGESINGIGAPNIISSQATNLRLAYYDEFLYFDYAVIGGGFNTLVLAFDVGAVERGEAPGGWFWDIYNPSIVMHYGEEGSGVHSLLVGSSSTGLYQYTGTSDAGGAFSMEFTTPCRNQGQPRENKLYGDVMLDADLNGATASVTPFFNNNTTSTAAVAVTNASRTLTTIPFGSSWQTARNVSINVIVSITTQHPVFYIWEPRWTFESAPVAALSWEISPSSLGSPNFKHVGLCKITHVSTVNLSLIFTIDGVVQPTITIPNSGGIYKQDIFRVPVMKGKIIKVRLASSDGATDFRLDPRDTFIEIKEWASDAAYQEMRLFADYALIEGSANLWMMLYLAGLVSTLLFLLTITVYFGLDR